MADTKTSALTALTGANSAPLDLIPIVDVSDTTQGAGGTLKNITRQEFQTYNAGTLTADDKVSNRTVTLNQGATIFNVDQDDVTDTASATETRLKSWKVGGVLKASIRKDGAIHCWNGTPTDTNYERGFMRWASNVLEIGAEAAGTGTQRAAKVMLNGATNYISSSADGYITTCQTLYGTNWNTANGFLNLIQSPTSCGIKLAGHVNDSLYCPQILLANFATPPTPLLNVQSNSSHLRSGWLVGKYGGVYASSTGYQHGTGWSIYCGYGATPTTTNADGGNAGNFDVWLNAGGAGNGTGAAGANGKLRVLNDATDGVVFSVTNLGAVSFAADLLPLSDNAVNFGSASYRLKELFCANATINTSDARAKTEVSALTVAEIAAAKALALEIGKFQFLDSVAVKGDKARLHIGMTVQRAIEIMAAHGLIPTAYSFICYDKWDAEYTQVQINAGEKVTVKKEVTRQAFELVPVTSENIEVIDGKPVLVKKTAEEKQLLTDPVPVLDEAGLPVMTATEDGELVPLTYGMPRMETVVEDVEEDAPPVYEKVLVRAAGDAYGFRAGELALFIAAGMAASAV